VFRPIRTAISVLVLGGALWAAFAVEIGDKTFAQHIDTISETPEAKQLVEDTRATINPALVEIRDRVLGEYVEAPTWIADQPAASPAIASSPERAPRPERPPSSERAPDRVAEPPLPGHRGANKPGVAKPDRAAEPPLPGRR
jgi:hypothetical protein